MIEQIQTRRIYTQVAGQLQRLIGDGMFLPGTYLPTERELAQRFGVSRSSIREGIIALEVMGYVDVRVGAGVMVLKLPTEDDAPLAIIGQRPGQSEPDFDPPVETEVPPFDLLRARLLIEPECAALAAENGSDQQIQRITDAYHRNVEDNQARSKTHPGDREFHICIAEGSGNLVYANLVRQLLGRYGDLFQRLQRLYTPNDMPFRSEHEHLEILNAIQERKPIRARNAMQAHLQAVIAIFSRDT